MPPVIVYEDAGSVVVDKPAGQPTIPGRGAVAAPLNLELEAALGLKVYTVHRLDRLASGLVLFAKTARAHALYCRLFEERRVGKSYLLAVDGRIDVAGAVDLPLREFGSGRTAVSPAGKPSLTRYAPRAAGRDATLVVAEPVTGRRHQLRAHFYAIGHPILGDPLYGAVRPVAGEKRLMLHAQSLTVPGLPPLLSPAPEDFRRVLARRGLAT